MIKMCLILNIYMHWYDYMLERIMADVKHKT